MMPVIDSLGAPITGLYRDKSGALIVKSDSELLAYKTQKSIIDKDKERIQTLEEQINNLTRVVEQLIQERR